MSLSFSRNTYCIVHFICNTHTRQELNINLSTVCIFSSLWDHHQTWGAHINMQPKPTYISLSLQNGALKGDSRVTRRCNYSLNMVEGQLICRLRCGHGALDARTTNMKLQKNAPGYGDTSSLYRDRSQTPVNSTVKHRERLDVITRGGAQLAGRAGHFCGWSMGRS